MRKMIFFGVVFLSFFFTLALVSSAEAQLFQNNNASCEDKVVVGQYISGLGYASLSHSIACGRFSDDTALGNPDFSDCITQRDPIPFAGGGGDPQVSNSVLMNTGAHGQNCFNLGEQNQFEDAINLQNEELRTDIPDYPIRMGTIRTGRLDSSDLDAWASVFVEDYGTRVGSLNLDKSIQFLFPLAAGGFNPGNFFPFVAELQPGATSRPIPFPIDPIDPPAPVTLQNKNADRSLILLDCDGDGVDEGVVSVRDITGSTQLGIMVLKNNGAGLEDSFLASDFEPIPVSITGNVEARVSLASGDFNGDGLLDIMVAADTEAGTPDQDAVVFCAGNGACGFSCPTNFTDPEVFDTGTLCGADCGTPSIAAGDFDGDGLLDVAVPEPENTANDYSVRYIFNNGGSLSSWDTSSVEIGFRVYPAVVTTGRFSVDAIQSGTDELAINIRSLGGGPAYVSVITTDGNGGLNAPTVLNFALANPAPVFASGLDSQDFDHCGGDDIIALSATSNVAPSPDIDNYASLFLNTNEPPAVTAIANSTTIVGGDLPVTASCVDPTGDDRTFDWTVVTSPPGSTVTFGTPTGDLIDPDIDASTTFSADSTGSYTIQLTCTDFCGAVATTTLDIDVTPAFTQGGCIRSSLIPHANGEGMKRIWLVFLSIPGLFFVYRFGRRGLKVFQP